MSRPGVAAKKRFGFALGCGCKDPKAVAVAASSPRSGTEASTATSLGARTRPSGSASTGTLTVPSASSSFLWEDADGGEEIEFKRASSATATPSFSGLLRELNELEQSVKSCAARKSPGRNRFSPTPPPPPLPSSRPVQRRAVRGDERTSSIKEGHGDFSPPRPSLPVLQTQQQQQQQHRRVKSVDKVNPHFTPLLPPRPLPPPPPLEPPQNAEPEEDGAAKKNKQDPKRSSTHRKAKSCDATTNDGFVVVRGGNRLDGSVAVVKQSEDPLSDFRRSMVNMIVENGIVAGDELRELLRRFLALNAPRHHDAILRAFAEIWDEVFAPTAGSQQPTRQTAAPAPRQRTPPRRRQPPPAWRV